MEANDAIVLARRLMDEFELHGWRVEFDRSVKRFGACHRKDSKITLSYALVTRNDASTVEDVIRHEIAHALAPPRANHNREWIMACNVTGARPQARYDGDSVVKVEAPWDAVCGGCGRHWPRHRRKRNLSHYVHGEFCGDLRYEPRLEG